MYRDIIKSPAQTTASANRAQSDAQMTTFINQLLAQMTLDEKIGQLDLQSGFRGLTGPFVNPAYEQQIRNGQVGAIFNAYGADFGRKLQQIAVEETRLGIPLLIGHDVIHGHKTIFPQPIGAAATWDLDAIRLSAKIAAKEATADGIMWTFAPMADLVRDPRWGRVAESAGEDPFLTAAVAVSNVQGFQGEDLARDDTLMATAKHFVGYGAVEGGRDYNTTNIAPHQLWNQYLVPFKAMIDAGVGSVMSGFNDLNGTPVTASQYLLTTLLRDTWAFSGVVVSDYTAINELVAHGFAKNNQQAAERAFNAGVDMDMVGKAYLNHLKAAITRGKVSEAQLDQGVRRVLAMKWQLGLFADPYRYHDVQRAQQRIGTTENRQAALDVARRSLVLLKNKQQTLPLDRHKINKLAVVGPLANDRFTMIGNWAGAGDRSTQPITVTEGLKNVLGNDVDISYAKGATNAYLITHTGMTGLTNIDVPVSAKNRAQLQNDIDHAVALASDADAIVMVLGEDQRMSGEAASRTELSLPGNQQALMTALKALHKPLILVVMSGRPNDLRWADKHVEAIIQAWYPGTMGGQAIADILTGRYNPSGKLPITFPRSVGQIPLYYNHKNTGRPLASYDPSVTPAEYSSRYDDAPNSPLYPFGYGLSYTQFTYTDMQMSANTLSADGSLKVSIRVTNSGERFGEEVVQLYTRQKVGSITRPVKELKGFQKIALAAKESQRVSFVLTPQDLAFYRADLTLGTEPGDFDVMLGGASNDLQIRHFTLLE